MGIRTKTIGFGLLLMLIFFGTNRLVGSKSRPSLEAAQNAPQVASGRLTVLISDLHMGLGGPDPAHDKWDPYEDFRWKDEFVGFLHRLNVERS